MPWTDETIDTSFESKDFIKLKKDYKGMPVFNVATEDLIVCFDRTEVNLMGYWVAIDSENNEMIIHPSSYKTLEKDIGWWLMENWVFDGSDDIILNKWDLDPDGDFDFQQFNTKGKK